MLTSANLSKQAWGEASTSIEFRIASWEIGVLVWPELLTGSSDSKMVGVFQTDYPAKALAQSGPVVGLRIPYNFPLQAYGPGEVPWVGTLDHKEPDRLGMIWAQ
jgi:tyrosyl-DNA phosphodiesterase-1